MKKLFRLISPQKLEVYHLNRRGELNLREEINPRSIKLKRIKHLLISANYTNWDTTQIENVAYKPKPNTNLFSSKSLFNNENLVTSNAYFNEQTGYWAQAWTSDEKLSTVWKLVSKSTIIYPEALNIVCKTDVTFWQSGPCSLTFSKETGFSSISKNNNQDSVIAKTLDGFLFSPKVSFQKQNRKAFSSLFWPFIFLLGSLVFSWHYSFRDTVNLLTHPPATFENTLTGLPLLQTIQNKIPDGALSGVEFNQRKRAVTLIFLSDEIAERFLQKVTLDTDLKEHVKIEKIQNTIVLSAKVAE